MSERLKIKLDHEKIDVITDKLLHVKYYENLPDVFSKPKIAFTLLTQKYFLLAILDETSNNRISMYMKENNHPFPGLIALPITDVKTGFVLNNSKFSLFENTKVVNRFSFKLGVDSTAILSNHYVSINTDVLDSFNYNIELLYLISFGSEITLDNFYEYLDELIDFSFTYWKSNNG